MRREEEEVKVGDIKQKFPWGQLNREGKDKVIMRFGLTKNSEGNCDIWIDLEDSDSVPFVEEGQVYVQV